ncbi:MAG TPA: hypothetical protein VE995_08915 [Gaiellaceae bacterium]|nr:hypothetical protein [Gaiellaceae bacterium]
MVELVVRPRGPYSLRLSARLAGDATRRLRDGVLVARVPGGLAQARQAPDGSVAIRAESPAAAERLRWMLALDADHSPFLRRVERDPLLGPASRRLRGLRPLRTATVAHALLRAVCGQLVDWRTARALERRVLRALATRHASGTVAATVTEGSQAAAAGLLEPPTTAVVAAAAPFELRRVGLHERRAAALVRVCRSVELERLHALPTETVVRRLERERGLGPWSAGVVCLEGLGRPEHGLVGDLGLLQLVRALRGRPAQAHETAELLEPYGEWAGLASVYLLAGFSRGLIPLAAAPAA